MRTTPPREPAFDPMHAPLRADVGFLGGILGEVIRDQSGEALFAAVEAARAAAIDRRQQGAPLDALRDALSGLPPAHSATIVQAFSIFFSLTNLAEQVHRIRRRRDYQIEGVPQPGSLEAVFETLRDVNPDRLDEALRALQVIPVFTAHPTEATRRTILKKEQRIARALVDRIEQTRRTPMEDRRIARRIRTEVGLIWQTAEQASSRPTVADEVEHVVFFLSEVLYRVMPAFHEEVDEAAARVRGIENRPATLRPLVRFGSWVGGDMDGNPAVGTDTLLATLARHRKIILDLYRAEVRALFGHLSQSRTRIEVSIEIDDRCRRYADLFPEIAARIPARHRDMPYRVLLWLVWERLGRTVASAPDGYESPEALAEDIELIDRSLTDHHGAHAGRRRVRRLLIRVRTFGFHLATLDLRQDAAVLRRVAERMPAGGGRNEDAPADEETSRTLAVFRAVKEARLLYGLDAVGPYIISMARGVDDVLAVLTLARAAGLVDPDGSVPLDVAPLFETVDDLQNAHRTLASMTTHPFYREHLRRRGDEQTVMLGYSDSAKISGVGASRWALYQAQERLVATAKEAGIRLVLFHGRGGTIARGGSKPREAILAEPPGAVRGRLRTTEQGEIINGKFGLRGIAERTLELTVGAVLEATVREGATPTLPAPWRQAMDILSRESATAWTRLVREDPRFIPYFEAATPIDVIRKLSIGSRPASRRGGGGIDDLRAIPWVFAWTQSRHLLPGWYGLGAGLAAVEDAIGLDALRAMARGWPFFENLLADAEMTLAKADLVIASEYAALAPGDTRSLFAEIRDAYRATCERVLRIRDEEDLLEREPVLRQLIRLRNPYVDPMSMIQVDLLRRWRADGSRDDEMLAALFGTVRGIARGLRNTG